ncbi:MAG: TRAP transporter small permease [Burkholderiaceae bacterium]|nr:TRAP transporter small permease [Burkholderiaceae bacterium]
MRLLEKLSESVNGALAWAAGLALIAMMLFTVGDMALRALGRPVAGSYEIIGWLSAAAMALALGYTQVHRGHVAIDLLTTRLKDRTRAAIELVTSLLALLLFAAVAWQLARYGRVLQETGSLSETLKAIVYPWVYVVAAGAAGLALALLVEFVKSVARLRSAARQDRPAAPDPTRR